MGANHLVNELKQLHNNMRASMQHPLRVALRVESMLKALAKIALYADGSSKRKHVEDATSPFFSSFLCRAAHNRWCDELVIKLGSDSGSGNLCCLLQAIREEFCYMAVLATLVPMPSILEHET